MTSDYEAKINDTLRQHHLWVQNPSIGARADFSGENLTGYSFPTGMSFRSAIFRSARLDEAIIHPNTDLASANFTEAFLQGAKFADISAPQAVFYLAQLQQISLNGAYLFKADFRSAHLVEADLKGADLTEATFQGANLTNSSFEHANLCNADLRGANLENAKEITLDSSWIRDTSFSPNSSEPWLTLRRTYTGTRFFLNLLLVAISIAPLAAKALLLFGISYVQFDKSSLLICPSNGCTEVKVWRMLLGLHESSWWPFLSILFTTLYNVARLGMTVFISNIRESEAISGRSPPLILIKKLTMIKWLLVFPLFVFSIVALTINFWNWKDVTILIP